MSTYFPATETPLFWAALIEGYDEYTTLGPLSSAWPGDILSMSAIAHQWGCQDPYGKPAWCDCNNLTRADACDCEGTGCTWCLF